MNKLSLKTQLILFLSIFIISLSIVLHDMRLLLASAITCCVCGGVDLVFVTLQKKKRVVPASAVITGLIISLVMSSSSDMIFFIYAGIAAIVSKYFLRLSGKHIFNPAAFGVFLMVVCAGQATAWQGSSIWYVFIPYGLYIVWRLRKMTIVAVYSVMYIVLYGIQAIWTHTSMWDTVQYANYFLVFIMLIEPKTSPFDMRGKYIFGICVCSVSFVLYNLPLPYDAALPALLLGNSVFSLMRIKKEAL